MQSINAMSIHQLRDYLRATTETLGEVVHGKGRERPLYVVATNDSLIAAIPGKCCVPTRLPTGSCLCGKWFANARAREFAAAGYTVQPAREWLKEYAKILTAALAEFELN